MRSAMRRNPVLTKGRVSPPQRPKENSYRPTSIKGALQTNPTGNVCVIRSLGGLGDVLMVTPLLMEIKRQFPQCHLTFAIDRHRVHDDSYYQLLSNAPFIDQFVDARRVVRTNYDAVVDVTTVCIAHENSRAPNLNRIDIFGRAAGFPVLQNKVPYFKIEVHETAWANAVLANARSKNKKLVALHTASMDEKRTWPLSHYMSLVTSCINENIHFVVFDWNNKADFWSAASNVTNMSSASIREMASLINQCDLFVGPDSGPMHLAAATHTKSLVLFGSIPPGARINHYPTHEAIRLDKLGCLGCWYRACNVNFRCMKELTPEMVRARMLSML